MVMDVRGVVTGDGAIAEQPGQHFGADLGQFIEEQVRASVLGVDGEQAGSSRWLQHHVAGSDGGGARRDDAKSGGGRERGTGESPNGPASTAGRFWARSWGGRCGVRFSAWTGGRPVPADGSSTTSPGRMAAAIAATTPSPVGVENCCNAWEVWDRRVWVGSRAPIFSIIARAAAGDTDLRRIVEPYLRRNRICAASQAS